ncbi:MAG: TatD family hydrolase [Bacteroides sp.]|nr:TatD family hydrolase [Bacteroides sp.]MCM1379853.1 TatD family hydrolase [Bacteroides sp.]MCM1446115.1 TatD family hydrolase [Prevotella sp.]
MIDTHTHLYLPDYGEDKCAAVDRALAAGVELMVLPGVDADSIEPIRELHALRPDATAMCVGLHPTEVHPENWREHLTRVADALTAHDPLPTAHYSAVGEIGLDLYWDKSQLSLQLEACETQLDIADSLNLPAIIHCRDAMPRMLDLMEGRKGRLPWLVFHCYSGTADDVDRLRRLQPDVMFGIGGVLTFKKSPLPDIVPQIGLNHILLETDAPWLAPVPMRGKQNESAYIPYIAAKLAETMQISVAEVDAVTTHSARTFFKL